MVPDGLGQKSFLSYGTFRAETRKVLGKLRQVDPLTYPLLLMFLSLLSSFSTLSFKTMYWASFLPDSKYVQIFKGLGQAHSLEKAVLAINVSTWENRKEKERTGKHVGVPYTSSNPWVMTVWDKRLLFSCRSFQRVLWLLFCTMLFLT